MTERKFTPLSDEENRDVVLAYYEREKDGYWNLLNGRCHYDFSPLNSKGLFNIEEAQIAMEEKLGEALGLSKGSKVLDAGCGFGPVARTLSNKFGYEVTGIDLIHERLKTANEINKNSNLSGIKLANVDYHNLPFPDNTFEGVYTMETLVHAHDHGRVLQEFRRVLKPGGVVALFEYTIPPLESVPNGIIKVRDTAERVIKNTGMASLPYFTHGSFPQILESAGFENVSCQDISKNVYPSFYFLWKHAVGLTLRNFMKGDFDKDKIPGSFYIWPARHKLGYVISRAEKPQA